MDLFNKMRSACGQRHDLANEIFNYEIYGIPQSLCTGLDSMYHGTKADITKRLHVFHISSLPDKECQSAIIIEMSPNYSIEMLHSSKRENREDLVFDRYFEKSLKEETRKK